MGNYLTYLIEMFLSNDNLNSQIKLTALMHYEIICTMTTVACDSMSKRYNNNIHKLLMSLFEFVLNSIHNQTAYFVLDD